MRPAAPGSWGERPERAASAADPLAAEALMAELQACMRAAVADRGDERDGLYGWLRYHLGWADLAGRPEQASAGKGIRARACLTACAAVGGPAERALQVAAAIELTHAFSLIHDDIEDGDRQRRGRAALWTLVGIPQAINAGDALFSIARLLLSRPAEAPEPEVRLRILAIYDAACLRLAEGQYLDLRFEDELAVSQAAYHRMVAGKTGALLGAATATGALAGGAEPEVSEALARFGESVGLAFQMHDDVLGMWGDPARTGKPAGADLGRRKRSLPVIMGLEDPGLGPELAALLRSEGALAPETVARWAGRLAEAGFREGARDMARREAAAARAILADLDLAPEPRSALDALARQAVERDH